MSKRKTAVITAAAFFCAGGWVYSGSAIGAQPETAADPATPATPGLFDNKSDTPAPATPAADTAMSTKPATEPAAATTGDAADKGPVSVGTFGQIDLHVKDLELSKVLQLLSIQSQRNII